MRRIRLYGKWVRLTVQLARLTVRYTFWSWICSAAGWLRDHNPFGGIQCMAEQRTIQAQRYLEDYRVLVTRRDALLAAENELHAAAEQVGLDEAPGEKTIRTAMEHVGEALTVRMVLLELMEDERLKTLLYLRYINGQEWEQVAREMRICRSRAFGLHRDALKAFGEILRETP